MPPALDWRVISIGALDAHPEWGERDPVRTGHATTTLIRAQDRIILVDPALPPQILAARLPERAAITPTQITDVFLTCFRPDVRRALELFEDARWLIAEQEREAVGLMLIDNLTRAGELADDDLANTLRQEVATLRRCEPAPDTLAERVDLFPLPGVTPGLAGLLLAEPKHTTLICGDAIPTTEHLHAGKVVQWAADVNAAKQAFTEAIEIADILVLGRDNAAINPTRRPF